MHSADTANRKTAGPWVDIDLTALCENFAMLRAAAPSAETTAVVKCDAYGLGLAPVALALATREQCRTFFVAYPEEGVQLRETLGDVVPDATIYVFNGPLPDTIPVFETASLTPVINSLEQARDWATQNPSAPCAVHIDTGMNRLGAPGADASALAALTGLNVEMVMSHLACGSDAMNVMNATQRDAFIETAKLFPNAKRSFAASAGVLMDASYHFDLTRPGIALYGGTPFDVDDARIKPVASLNAPVVQIRRLSPGETVGYGATFTATRPTTIATVALGYGDGFLTAGSNRATAAIGGERAKIAGRVSMDLIGLDVTDFKKPPEIGAIAEFFGRSVSLFEAATACATAPYELLTGLGGRVDRRYV